MVLSEVVTMKILKTIQIAPLHVGSNNPSLDLQSKVFIISQAVMGVNRLALFPNMRNVFRYICSAYSLLTVILTLYFNSLHPMNNATIFLLIEYLFHIIYGFIFTKLLRKYFIELTKFDREVGCRPKYSFKVYSKYAGAVLTTLFTAFNFYLSHILDVVVFSLPMALLGVHIVRYNEVFFGAHLFDLMLPRLQLINYYVDSSFVVNYSNKEILQEYEVFAPTVRDNNVKVKHIMDLYQTIVSAHDSLVKALKWQVLIVIVIAFMTILSFGYEDALVLIHGTRNILGAIVNIGMLLAFLAMFVAPCSSSERVHQEALRLRELLTTRLFDTKLDKNSRSVARALIALTESRDLSFSLMDMFTVDLSLPITFTSLLLTYLIIMLQFDKVINN